MPPDTHSIISTIDFRWAHTAAIDALSPGDTAALLVSLPERARADFLSSLGRRHGVSPGDVPAWALNKIQRADAPRRDAALKKLLPAVRRKLETILEALTQGPLDPDSIPDCVDQFGVGALRLGCTSLGQSGSDVSRLLLAFAEVPTFVLDDESFTPLREASASHKSLIEEGRNEAVSPATLAEVLTATLAGVDAREDLQGAIRATEDSREDARLASEQIQHDLVAGLAPALTDIERVCTLWARLDTLVAVSSDDAATLAGQGIDRNIDAILDAARALLEPPVLDRLPVERLLTVEGPADLGSRLEALRNMCRDAIAADSTIDSEGFDLLVELIDLANSDTDPEGSYERLDDLNRRARLALPVEFGAVVIGAVQGKLRITPPSEPQASSDHADAISTSPTRDHAPQSIRKTSDVNLGPAIKQSEDDGHTQLGPDTEVSLPASEEGQSAEPEGATDSDTAPADIAADSEEDKPAADGHAIEASFSPENESRRELKSTTFLTGGDARGPAPTGEVTASEQLGIPSNELDNRQTPTRVQLHDDSNNDDRSQGEQWTSEAPTTELLARLVSARKWALAHHWSAAYGLTGPAAAYAALAFVVAASSSDGGCAASFSEVTTDLTLDALQGQRGAIVSAASAAIRASLVAPLANGPAVIGTLRPAFTGLPSFNALLDAVTNSAVRGIDITTMASTAASIAATDDALAFIVKEAQQKATAAPTRTLKFGRATRVWQAWTAVDGILGSLLDIVARNQRERLQEAKSQVLHLRGRRTLNDAMDEADGRIRNGPHRGEAIEAGARTRLLDWANDILDIVSEWCNATSEQMLAGQSGSWQQEPLMDLRSAVREHSPHVQEELLGWAADDELVRAHVDSILPFLDTTWRMCDGQIETSTEPPVAQVIAADLLAVASIRFDSGSGLPIRDVTGPEVAEAADAPAIEEWYAARADAYDHVATGLIIDFLRRSNKESADRLSDERDQRIDLARSALEGLRTSAVDLLAQARRQGYVDEDTWASLAATVEANNPSDRLDLDVARAQLNDVKSSILDARAAAISEFESELIEQAARNPRVDQEAVRIRQLISRGDLATAQEALLLASDRGESLPDFVPESTLEAFNSALEQASRGTSFDSRAVVAATEGQSWGAFDFGPLDDAERAEVAESFTAWLGLSEPDRQILNDLLGPILRLGGIEVSKINKASKAGSSDRVWFDLAGVVRTGKALVPAFGSAPGTRLRLLVCKKSASIKVLKEWLKQDDGTSAVLVLRPGVTTARDRRELFDHFRAPQRQRTIGLIDDSVIAWLGTKGGRHFDELMKVVLPWAAHNPYTPHALGRVPVEMFYGRNQAVNSVISPTGAVFIYGGRQLGKSALLRAAARKFEDADKQVAIYIDLYSENIGRTRPANAIWETLWNSSLALGIVEGKAPVRNAFDGYRNAVLAWLRKDERRRLLILLDEADRFLDADAENGFSTTAQIKGLMEDSDRRCKVVLAGLHTVQRFVGLPNEPLTNIANPMSIGPMEPQAAFDLVTRPLEALGYRFADADVANRILAYCNFYPSLIQLFADALVTRLLESPLAASAPPQVVNADDIEAVYSSAELSDAFRHRLNLTLGLDEHYQAITYTVALMALTGKVDHPIQVGPLRERCREYWVAGFGSMAADQFRHLCDELVGLGVLARVGADGVPSYRLRSPNVLRMLGTEDMVMDRLTSVSSRPAPSGFPASTARANLSDGSSSPLTAAQTAELLAPRSQVLVVVGSSSGGISVVDRALREAAGTSVEMPVTEGTGKLRVVPSKDGRHRVQLLSSSHLDRSLQRAIGDASVALRKIPRGTTVAVIIVVDGEHGDELIDLFADAETAGRVVELGLLDGPAVRLLASERSLPYTEDADITALLDATGGIRSAVEAVAAKYAVVRSRPKALIAAEDLTATPEAAANFVKSCGVEGALADAFSVIMDLDGPQTVEELTNFVRAFSTTSEPTGAVRAILGLGALERLPDGRVAVPTLLAKAWTNSRL